MKMNNSKKSFKWYYLWQNFLNNRISQNLKCNYRIVLKKKQSDSCMEFYINLKITNINLDTNMELN